MKALCWNGKHDVRVEEVPDPKILNDRDAVIKITTTAICGSDLHLYDGLVPTMQAGDIIGHEFMGEVVETGKDCDLSHGQRVVIPFTIACGDCFFCKKQLTSLCDNSNPNAAMADKMFGSSPSGLFGYSHLLGGYAGGQAQYARVPYGDVGPFKIPDHLTDEQVLFLTDIFPTGYQAAENCAIEAGDTVAIWGCGPVGQFAIRSAFLLGAERVIGIDNIPERLKLARDGGAQTLNFDEVEILGALEEMTGGMGPDSCLDAVGMEAHGTAPGMLYDWAKQGMRLTVDRANAVRQMIVACRKGGHVSIAGVYFGLVDKMPLGIAFGKGLNFKMGQTHVHRYLPKLLKHIEDGDIDPTFLITHRLPLSEAPHGYEIFKHKKDDCIKVVLNPFA